ncbi:Acetyltransferase (GNAT) family protein [Aquimixticola soesokkakensis]|uniref:Acetyltransferase (GNAT) family protein n=1 Tax=Aquimixticola soesokkakensis TaxID=1519096 RepID=A0A1Y5SQ82_9RHOB|nr:GNAT family N-acetyltransferase [Aquimixticola soesokkakensis]SLN44173.1 Acetyltransferase (GNAT) family protein [Aquimixticola soesokkakensis]
MSDTHVQPPLSLRPITARDCAVWEAMWGDYLAFYNTSLPPETYAATFARLTDTSGVDLHRGIFACDADGTPVGLVHYLFHVHGWTPKQVCYLQDLWVTPQARGKGAARALIQAVYDAADAADAPQVYWMTTKDNTQARHLYDKVATLTPFIKYARPTT